MFAWRHLHIPVAIRGEIDIIFQSGTRVGDPEELSTLDEIYCNDRVDSLKIGSIKSNLGHSEAATGVCALVKVRDTKLI